MIELNRETFNPDNTFGCGQCFRWWREENAWRGIIEDSLVEVGKSKEHYYAKVLVGTLDDAALLNYFDDATDYETITKHLAEKDKWLEASVAYGKGIRLLRQYPFETLMTFILSSNNNIPKIKMSLEDLASRFGSPIAFENRIYYTFPTAEALEHVTLEELKVKAAGYRTTALKKAVERLMVDGVRLDGPYALSYDDGKTWLKSFYGVGDKVADCVLLFAYAKTEAFPVDTWVKRMLRELYGVEDKQSAYDAFVSAYFSKYGGFAQQYLFHYMRLSHSKRGES